MKKCEQRSMVYYQCSRERECRATQWRGVHYLQMLFIDNLTVNSSFSRSNSTLLLAHAFACFILPPG
jgi:hypothetical protein